MKATPMVCNYLKATLRLPRVTCYLVLTGSVLPARPVENSGEELEADDGVNNDDEYDEQRDVKQRHHCFEN